jgi:hypothetical protein
MFNCIWNFLYIIKEEQVGQLVEYLALVRRINGRSRDGNGLDARQVEFVQMRMLAKPSDVSRKQAYCCRLSQINRTEHKNSLNIF